MPTTQPVEWSYNRRSALFRQVQDAIYGIPNKQIPRRQFSEEARKKLPALFREIAQANKKIDRLNQKNTPNNRELILKLRHEALFGTSEQCQRIANHYLLGK